MTNTQSFESNPEIKQRVADMAKMLGRSKSWVVREALGYGLPILIVVEGRRMKKLKGGDNDQ